MLAIAPAMVGSRRPAGPSQPVAALLPDLRERGVRAVSASGVLGDPGPASAAEGRALLTTLIADLNAFLEATEPVAMTS